MGIGLFTDKTHLPASEEIMGALGDKVNLWQDLIQRLDQTYHPRSEYKYYGKNYGWALRFRKSGKALASFYPGQEGFTIQVVLGETEIAHALVLGLSDRTCRVIEDATPFPEGRWLFLRVEDSNDMEDAWRLVAVKMGKE